jgi:hypothetical protein
VHVHAINETIAQHLHICDAAERVQARAIPPDRPAFVRLKICSRESETRKFLIIVKVQDHPREIDVEPHALVTAQALSCAAQDTGKLIYEHVVSH